MSESATLASYSPTNYCYYCGRFVKHYRMKEGQRVPDNQKTYDHRMPKSRGGLNTPQNRVVSCARCNSDKGMLSENEYKAVLAYRQGSRAMLRIIAHEQAKNFRRFLIATAAALLLVNWRLRIWY